MNTPCRVLYGVPKGTIHYKKGPVYSPSVIGRDRKSVNAKRLASNIVFWSSVVEFAILGITSGYWHLKNKQRIGWPS